MNEITVSAPATVANIVCGFDILGFALSSPSDTFRLYKTNCKGVTIRNCDNYALPTDPVKNVSGAALLALVAELNEEIGFELESTKVIKPGSGIGSSAASAAGVVVAANYLLNNIFSRNDLVRFAMEGEVVASGARHADNIAPCIFGGVTLIRSNVPLDIIPINCPPLFVTVIHPQIEVKTADARQILKSQVPLKSAITQWGNVAGLVAGFMKGDYELIGRSLQDVIIEPVRKILIPGFDELKKQSIAAGALGGGISGSGPSVFMFSQDEKTAREVEQAMQSVYNKIGIDFRLHVTTVNYKGVEVIQ